MSRPIEPGCRVEVINASVDKSCIGKITTVTEQVHHPLERAWETELVDPADGKKWYFIESWLRRIDDYDGDEVTSWDECVWRPEVVA